MIVYYTITIDIKITQAKCPSLFYKITHWNSIDDIRLFILKTEN